MAKPKVEELFSVSSGLKKRMTKAPTCMPVSALEINMGTKAQCWGVVMVSAREGMTHPTINAERIHGTFFKLRSLHEQPAHLCFHRRSYRNPSAKCSALQKSSSP